MPSEPSSPFTSSSCDGTPMVVETVARSPRTSASRLRRKASTVTIRKRTKPANQNACGQASRIRNGVFDRFRAGQIVEEYLAGAVNDGQDQDRETDDRDEVEPISAGLFGVPLGFAVIIIVSLITPAPKKETQELVEHVRYPDLNLGKA